MKRWIPIRSAASPRFANALFFIAACGLLALASGGFSSKVQAQTGQTAQWAPSAVREFPKAALRGQFTVQQPPVIQIDGNPERLSPGSRIRGPNNLLVMSAAIVGQEFTVNYVREPTGLIHEVWILTPEEAALKRPRP